MASVKGEPVVRSALCGSFFANCVRIAQKISTIRVFSACLTCVLLGLWSKHLECACCSTPEARVDLRRGIDATLKSLPSCCFLRESCPRVQNTRNDTLVLPHPLGFRLCTYARVKRDEAQAQKSETSAGQRDTLLLLKAWKTLVHYLHHQSTNTTQQFPTWKVRGALGEVAEDGQTRYSQQERISDGWESPIWEEHPWSLRVLE